MQQNPASYQSLLEKFASTKKELSDTEETIRRITGRDPDRVFSSSGNLASGRPALFPGRKRPRFPVKSLEKEPTPEEYESPDEDGAIKKKPSIQSTVVAAMKDVKSRKDVIHEQNINSKVTARNRRMMGLVLGTLQKFQHEEKKRKDQVLKKAEKEQKVEAAAEEEKEQMKKEKEELFHSRREKQSQLRCLEKKLEIAEVHEIWEKSYRNLINYITTKAKPPIFFLPAVLDSKTKKCLNESKTKVLELLLEHRTATEQELTDIEEWYKREPFSKDEEDTQNGNEYGELSDLTVEMNNPMHQTPEAQEGPEAAQMQDVGPDIRESENAEADETDSANKNLANAVDQEFEPIYD